MIFSALSILGVQIYLLTGSGGFVQPSAEIRIYMPDAAGLQNGSPVRLNGIVVGKVRSVKLFGSRDPLRVVELRMSVRERYLRAIPEDSRAEVTAENLLGDRLIEITKGNSARPLAGGGELLYVPPREINRADLVAATQKILQNLDTLLADIETGKGTLGNLVKGEDIYELLRARVLDVQSAVDTLTSPKGKLATFLYDESFYEQIHAPVRQFDQAVARLRGNKFLTDAAQYDDTQREIARLRSSVEDLQKSRLLADDELYRKLQKQLDRLETTVNEVAYGPLFSSSQLYDSLNGSARQLETFFRELRANPQKFLRMKIF